LEEISNITGSFFLNALSDSTGLDLTPSPPVVMIDTIEDILDTTPAEVIQKDENILAIKVTFSTAGQQMRGIFLVMPTLDFPRVLLKHYQ